MQDIRLIISYEEATKALLDRQNEIAERLALEEASNNSKLTQRGNPTSVDIPIKLEAERGRDTNLEALCKFQV